MNIVLYLVPMALLLGLLFLLLFIMSAKSGQFDDLETPSHRILNDQPTKGKKHE